MAGWRTWFLILPRKSPCCNRFLPPAAEIRTIPGSPDRIKRYQEPIRLTSPLASSILLKSMGRPLRETPGEMIYHVLNRANGRLTIFETDDDYLAFEQILAEAQQRITMRLLAYCLMPNHWHLVLWPHGDGDLSRFVGWMTLTHTQRWHAFHQSAGSGHLYQGRFKSFPVQEDEHFLTVCRYVECNPVRAGLVPRAEAWPWGSLGRSQTRRRRNRLLALPLADPPPPALVPEGQRGAVSHRGRRTPAQHRPRTTIWRLRLATANRQTPRPGSHLPAARPTSERLPKRFLTPLGVPVALTSGGGRTYNPGS